VEFFKVLPGNEQGVAVANRAYIEKRKNDFILVNLRCRNLPGHHFTENAVGGSHSKILQ
jgi:hypothetical protein